MLKRRNRLSTFVTFLLLLLLCSCGTNANSWLEEKEQQGAGIQVSESTLRMEILAYTQGCLGFTTLDVNDVLKKIDEKDSFLLYTGRVTCEWCRKLVPTLADIVQTHQIEVFYLDSEDSQINDELKQFRETYAIPTVPSIIRFSEDGYYHIEHNVETEEFNENVLEENILVEILK